MKGESKGGLEKKISVSDKRMCKYKIVICELAFLKHAARNIGTFRSDRKNKVFLNTLNTSLKIMYSVTLKAVRESCNQQTGLLFISIDISSCNLFVKLYRVDLMSTPAIRTCLRPWVSQHPNVGSSDQSPDVEHKDV